MTTPPGGILLPGRRYVGYGETVLVPKHAVCDRPEQHKVEQGYYDGRADWCSQAPGAPAADAR